MYRNVENCPCLYSSCSSTSTEHWIVNVVIWNGDQCVSVDCSMLIALQLYNVVRRLRTESSTENDCYFILLHIITTNARHFLFCICLTRHHCMLFHISQYSISEVSFLLTVLFPFNSIVVYPPPRWRWLAQAHLHCSLFCCSIARWLGLGVHFVFRKRKPTNQTPSCEFLPERETH